MLLSRRDVSVLHYTSNGKGHDKNVRWISVVIRRDDDVVRVRDPRFAQLSRSSGSRQNKGRKSTIERK